MDDVLDLRAALRRAWGSLPVLLVGSALVAVAVLVAVVALRAGVLAGAVCALVLVPPVLMALVRSALEVIAGDEPTMRQHLASVPRVALRAIGICAVPATLAGLTDVALFAHARGGGAVMLVPAALGAVSTVLTLVAAVVLLPMRARDGGPTGWRAWLYGVHLFARSPLPYLAAVVVGGLGVWVSITVSNGLFVLVPGPFAFMLALAFGATAESETAGGR